MISGILLFLFLVILLIIRVPIALALIFSASTTYIMSFGIKAWWHWVSFAPLNMFSKYHFSVIPLFLLMGQIAASSNITENLFMAIEKLIGNRKGGIAMATLFVSTIFATICGSSLATAAAMSPICFKVMRTRGYSNELCFGTLAIGGTLGMLIPPSIVLVIYAIIAEQSLAKLSLAAIIPAIIALFGYCLAIRFYVKKYPDEVRDSIINKGNLAIKLGEKAAIRQKKFIISTMLIFCLFMMMLIGLYHGIFMPTEAAAIGVFGVLFIVIFNGSMWQVNWQNIFIETAKTTGMIIFIFLGAEIFNAALTAIDFPEEFSEFIIKFKDYPRVIIFSILILLVLFGCFMDGISIMLLIVPLFLPIIQNLDIGMSSDHSAIWFGILMLMVVEIGLITPPFGMNLFVIRSLIPEAKKVNIIKAIKYFLITDLLRVSLLVLFPQITLFLL